MMRTITIKLSFTNLALAVLCACLATALLTRGARAQNVFGSPTPPSKSTGVWMWFNVNDGTPGNAHGKYVFTEFMNGANARHADQVVSIPDMHYVGFHYQ